jgi:hypothetical protein
MTDDGMPAPRPPLRVIMTPDLVGGVWLDASCAAVFEAWGKGLLRPAVNRELLARYTRLWRRLGLSEVQIRRWFWRFTMPSSGEFVQQGPANTDSAIDCCAQLAALIGADCVVHRGAVSAPRAPVRWINAEELVRRLS